jgi:hypothetical protein
MPIEPSDVLDISIAADGKFTVNGEVMDSHVELTEQLSVAAGWNPQPALHVFPLAASSGGESEYSFMGKIIYTAFRAGFVDPQFKLHNEDGTIFDSKSQEPGQLDG